MFNVKSRGSIHRDQTLHLSSPIEDDHSNREHISETSFSSNSNEDCEESCSSADLQKSIVYAKTVENTNTKIVSKSFQLFQYLRKLFFVIILPFLIGYIVFCWSTPKISYQELQLKYPEQSDYLWNSLTVGAEDIIEKRSDNPSVYLFTHRGKGSVKQLLYEIAKQTSSFFGNNAPVEFMKEDFSSKEALVDYGYIIEKYKNIVEEGNVILIVDLNEIPAPVARALHTICDTHSPLVKKVIIFLTVVTLKELDNPTQEAETTLIDMWGSSIDRNELDPLITRVTDHVIPLKS